MVRSQRNEGLFGDILCTEHSALMQPFGTQGHALNQELSKAATQTGSIRQLETHQQSTFWRLAQDLLNQNSRVER